MSPPPDVPCFPSKTLHCQSGDDRYQQSGNQLASRSIHDYKVIVRLVRSQVQDAKWRLHRFMLRCFSTPEAHRGDSNSSSSTPDLAGSRTIAQRIGATR
ncbi:hypothetical protein JOB18_016784 [Solea senegalensis]|uniref:Uncharacterized protein n=1 Tax=Solea senegalensis TaxID=28829 RepID=A0AAV6Q5W6_SOLSE|nr:hypothetical protein JOB18_016784 [Solea senegalensis]